MSVLKVMYIFYFSLNKFYGVTISCSLLFDITIINVFNSCDVLQCRNVSAQIWSPQAPTSGVHYLESR